MAAPTKVDGKWRHRIMVKGQRVSGTFDTKAAALAWEAEQRIALTTQSSGLQGKGKTCEDAFIRYELEVSRKKKSAANEAKRLARLRASSLAPLRIAEVRPADIAAWRDSRLADGKKGSTINRDMNLLSHVFTVARREWHWIEESPTRDVIRPKESEPRDRRITEREIEAICLAMGSAPAIKTPPTSIAQRVALVFLFALETAMRAGEICGLRADDVSGRVAHLRDTKNGTSRNVPLSPRALEIWGLVPEGFGIDVRQLDANFRKYRDRAGVKDLTFHDTRHEAITRLARKLDVLDLARMVGHKNINQLRTYYNATAEDIASLL